MQFLFATAEAAAEHSETAEPGLFQALGLDWQLFIEQGIAFLILVFILAKFVYPVLVKTIEDRRAAIEGGLEEAKKAQEVLVTAETKVEEMLADARKEADDILARSHQEAVAMVAEAEDKAKTRADQIVSDAREQLDRDVRKARESLKQETVKLVAAATEHVIGEKLDTQKDAKLIAGALQEKA